MNAAELFLGLALIILIGFFAGVLAKRGHFPDLLVLILLGLLLGPVNSHWLHIGAIENGVGAIPFDIVTPLFGALALAVIMFDAGLHLPLTEVAGGMRRAILHTTLIFMLSVASVTIAVHYLLGFPWLVATFFGTIMGGVGSAVASSVVRTVRMSVKARGLVTIECLLVDVLTIGVAIALIEALRTGALDAGAVARAVVQTLAVGVTIGVAVGLAFVFTLPRMRGIPNLYILTLGSFLATYALIEYLGGSGPMGVLAFGLVLGNSHHGIFGGRDLAPELKAEIEHFHGQTTFLIRTFFFVLLGLAFSFEVAPSAAQALVPAVTALEGWSGTLALLWVAGVAAYLVILLARAVSCRFTAPEVADRLPLTLIVGRGLGSAVLATFPFTVAEMSDPTSAYARAMSPYQDVFPVLASIVIILTVLTTAAGVFWLQMRRPTLVTATTPHEGTVVSRERP